MEGIRRTVKLPGLKFHDLRRTFASLLAQRGVSTAVTQRLLEHSSPQLTNDVYTNKKSYGRLSQRKRADIQHQVRSEEDMGGGTHQAQTSQSNRRLTPIMSMPRMTPLMTKCPCPYRWAVGNSSSRDM
jgi:hypothetical protein